MEKLRILKIKEGDGAVFDQFCLELYPNLISYARIFLPEEWAQDIVQDVFFSVWENRERLDEESSVKSYIFRSVHNRALNFIESQKTSYSYRQWNKNRIIRLSMNTSNYESNPVIHNLYNSELRTNINKAIQSLPERQREVFILSYIELMSNQQIADKLGLSLRTVGNHMYLALKSLREKLSSEELCLLLMVSPFINFLGS